MKWLKRIFLEPSRPQVCLTHEVLTPDQLKYMMSVGVDHPVIRAVIYILDSRIQQSLEAMNPQMKKAELTYVMGGQDQLLDLLVQVREMAEIREKGDGKEKA